jgi:tetratricopeptide (TPR) repeat protein
MNQTIKENSPLELYETAYKLHYADGNILEACNFYKAIIDEFPNSNECGYAVIQLQKIQANSVSESLQSTTNRFALLQFIVIGLCLVICLTLSTAAFLSSKKTNANIEALSMVSQAISLIYAGYDSEALELLNKAKTVSSGKLCAPYLLSANIFINTQQYARAKAEFDIYQRISGKNDSVFKKIVAIKPEKIEKKTQSAKIDTALEPEAVSAVVQPTPPPAPVIVRQAVPEKASFSPSATRTKQKSERIKSGRSLKSGAKPTQNGADTISFF